MHIDADRIAIIYDAADAASKTRSDVWGSWSPEGRRALILAMQWHESGHFFEGVWTGEKRGDHGNSVCLGQINRTAWVSPGIGAGFDRIWAELGQETRPVFPEGLLGAPGALACAAATWAVLTAWAHHGQPEGDWATARILTGYGTGRTASPQAWVWPRVGTWRAMKVPSFFLRFTAPEL